MPVSLMNEGFRILEEGVVQRASDIDVVWTAGYGFPRYRGGPMFHAELIGLKTLLDGMLRFQAQFGPMHWEPAPPKCPAAGQRIRSGRSTRMRRASTSGAEAADHRGDRGLLSRAQDRLRDVYGGHGSEVAPNASQMRNHRCGTGERRHHAGVREH